MAGWMLQLRMTSFGAFPHLVYDGVQYSKEAINVSSRLKTVRGTRLEKKTVKSVLDLMLCCPCAALLLQLDVVAQRRRGDTIQV
jgi:hypothetical protein